MIAGAQEVQLSHQAETAKPGGVVKREPTAYASDVPAEVSILSAGYALRLFGEGTKAKALGKVDAGYAVVEGDLLEVTAGRYTGETYVVRSVRDTGAGTLLLELGER